MPKYLIQGSYSEQGWKGVLKEGGRPRTGRDQSRGLFCDQRQKALTVRPVELRSRQLVNRDSAS
jgi:hypothetical protein